MENILGVITFFSPSSFCLHRIEQGYSGTVDFYFNLVLAKKLYCNAPVILEVHKRQETKKSCMTKFVPQKKERSPKFYPYSFLLLLV